MKKHILNIANRKISIFLILFVFTVNISPNHKQNGKPFTLGIFQAN